MTNKMRDEKNNEYSNIIGDNKDDLLARVMKLVERLDDDDWKNGYEHSKDSVESSQRILAEQYFKIYKLVIVSIFSLTISLVLTDLLFPLNSLLYGLTVSIWGSILLTVPSLKGRFQISVMADGLDKDAIREIEAKRMTYTNAGLGFLILGFFLQLVSHQTGINNIIPTDILSAQFPSWVAIPSLFVIFGLAVSGISVLSN